MKLLLSRSQREGGTLSKKVIFCLYARVTFTAAEQQNITRYKLQNEVIYNSEASKRHLDRGDAARDGSMVGGLKSLASTALAAMNLNITIASLGRGQPVECKSLEELLAAEDAIMEACRNLKNYLDKATTFDGREVLYDFSSGEPVVVAQAGAPAPMLAEEPAPVARDRAPPPAPAAAPLPPDDRFGYAPPAAERVSEDPAPFVAQTRSKPAKSRFSTVDGWTAAIKSDPQLRMGVYAIGLLLVVAILWLFVIR